MGAQTLALDDAESRIHRHSATTLRLHVAGTPENGADAVSFADGSGDDPGPRVALHLCIPPPAPAACNIITVNSDGMAEVVGSDSSFPPPFGMCNDPGQVVAALADSEMETFESRALLLSWNTLVDVPGLTEGGVLTPSDGELVSAAVQLHVVEVNNDDGLSLVGDWRQWSCAADDYTAENAADAVSADGACGSNCALEQIEAGHDLVVPLDNADPHINALGRTQLRLQISGTPGLGANGLVVADGSDEEHPAPQLLLEVCPPSEHTPEPGCHYDVFSPDANGWTASASGGTGSVPEFTFTACDNDQFYRAVGTLNLGNS